MPALGTKLLFVLKSQLLCLLVTIALYAVIWKKRILRGSHNERNFLWDKITRTALVGTFVGPSMLVFRRW